MGGTDKANVDTLAEWIAVAEAVADAGVVATNGSDVRATMVFEFGGDTYVVQTREYDSDATAAVTDASTTEAVVKLVGVTGITGVSTTAAANVIDIA